MPMTKVHSMVKAPSYVLSTLLFWSTLIMHRLDILFCYELSIYPTKIMRHCDKSNNVNAALYAPVSCDWKAAATAKCDIDHLSLNWLFLPPPGGQLPKPANPGGGLEHLGSPRRVHKPGATLGEGGAGSTNYPHWAASTTTGASVSTAPGASSSVILSIYYYSELKMQNGCEWIPILFQGKSTWDSQEITGRWGNWKKIIPYHPFGTLFWVCCRYENAMCAGKGLGSTVTMEARWVWNTKVRKSKWKKWNLMKIQFLQKGVSLLPSLLQTLRAVRLQRHVLLHQGLQFMSCCW